ncbi:hypothetical protein BV22DRAFT_1196541 [Leucogyrophana mollusca]|uniref:Uncharacterized protein n=1 Tax=Leucogyrophana mollusca TaxID=85980 RepID=A0ACB8BER3_9AGAM|nr:hypothetical protein BV22DRAFT_1196541 [Leucogyrophana mollusca]
MGKWTPEYYDDVLGAKMRSLVSGAIKRAKLGDDEKTEPTISYEAFVEELSTGDSFTTSIIEVLVKELAERRLRDPADRGLIADRTMRSLRRLSSPATVYRPRNHGRGSGGRRGVDLTEYLSQPPDELEMDDDDDEIVASYSPFISIADGRESRTNSHPYGPQSHNWSNPVIPYRLSAAHNAHPPATEANADRVLPPLQESSSTNRTSGWTLPSASGLLHTTLARQSSLRRPARSRTADFSEFTSRRRNSTRQLAEGEGTSRPESTTSFFMEPSEPLPNREAENSSTAPPQARHFFPFARRFEVIPTPRPAASGSDEWYFPPSSAWSGASQRSTPTNADHETSEERSQAPRLRRGGLRAPESILSRHASPATYIDLPHPPTLSHPEPGVDIAAPSETTRSVSEEILQSIGGP